MPRETVYGMGAAASAHIDLTRHTCVVCELKFGDLPLGSPGPGTMRGTCVSLADLVTLGHPRLVWGCKRAMHPVHRAQYRVTCTVDEMLLSLNHRARRKHATRATAPRRQAQGAIRASRSVVSVDSDVASDADDDRNDEDSGSDSDSGAGFARRRTTSAKHKPSPTKRARRHRSHSSDDDTSQRPGKRAAQRLRGRRYVDSEAEEGEVRGVVRWSGGLVDRARLRVPALVCTYGRGCRSIHVPLPSPPCVRRCVCDGVPCACAGACPVTRVAPCVRLPHQPSSSDNSDASASDSGADVDGDGDAGDSALSDTESDSDEATDARRALRSAALNFMVRKLRLALHASCQCCRARVHVVCMSCACQCAPSATCHLPSATALTHATLPNCPTCAPPDGTIQVGDFCGDAHRASRPPQRADALCASRPGCT